MSRRAALLLAPLAALGALATGCCVAPPRARDLLAVGFRTPEQTFATFQTAVRADEPELQRRCFSAGFQATNHVSSFAWRTFWEDLVKAEPFLRKGIVDARATGPADVSGTRARLEAESHGRRIVLELVQDDFCEVWRGGAKVVDEGAPFAERTGVQTGQDGRKWIFGRLPLPEAIDPAGITELRFGREWKIDRFEILPSERGSRASVGSGASGDLP